MKNRRDLEKSVLELNTSIQKNSSIMSALALDSNGNGDLDLDVEYCLSAVGIMLIDIEKFIDLLGGKNE